MRSKPEGLIFRKGVHSTVMKDGQKGYGSAASRLDRHMLLGEWGDIILLFGEPVLALAHISQRTDVVIRKFAIQYETAQSIALPSRAAMRPFKYFL
jgi:hypothetical protein